MNNAVIETLQTAPMVISTRLGGMVSVMAPVADSSATSSSGAEPRRCISGSRAGAMAAMSAAFEPEMPDTRNMAPSSTYCRPPRTWPSRADMKSTSSFARPLISSSAPSSTNSGTAKRIMVDMPSSTRPTTICRGASESSAR